jgi:hypothetical protein
MILQLNFKATKPSNSTHFYMKVECLRWSVSNGLLAVETASGVRYYPLENIESFTQLED